MKQVKYKIKKNWIINCNVFSFYNNAHTCKLSNEIACPKSLFKQIN
jgi:hypothetical protein